MAGEHETRTLTIGQLVRRLGLNVRTLRYYECIGLVPAPARTESGYRLYSQADEQLLRFVLHAKRLGFSPVVIRRIVQLGREGSACGYVREALSERLAELDVQIADLQRLRSQLSAVANEWQERGSSARGRLCGLIERWAHSPLTIDEEGMMATRTRKVEVFTAGCPICEPAVELVRRIAGSDDDVTIYDVNSDPQAAARARAANVTRLPTVLVDGRPAGCCQFGPVTEADLRAAGVGTR
jgi:MerR family mercuric resistance operon transcriptional regulator